MSSPDTNQLHKELDLIQGIITRMANHSFDVKKWMITIIAAIVLLDTGKLSTPNVICMLSVILAFWYLDTYFICMERNYRALYNWVISNRSQTADYLYDLSTFTRTVNGSTENLKKPENGFWPVFLSKTVLPIYLLPILLTLGYFLYNHFMHAPTCCGH